MQRDEMIVGAAVLILSSLFLYTVWRVEAFRLDFRLADVAQGWRIPGYLVSKNIEIVKVLLKCWSGRGAARSLYRVSGFKTSNSNPRLAARQILATLYTTVAPNFIVIGIDDRQSRMLFHQIERTGISTLTKALGARTGAKRT